MTAHWGCANCGHGKPAHTHTGWPRYQPRCDTRICCNAKRRGHPGGPDGHDMIISHKQEWCQCTEFVSQQQEEEGNNA